MAKYNCVLLDLDGTVLDFSASEDVALDKTLRWLEVPVTDEICAEYKKINSELWSEFENGNIKKEKLVVVRWQKLLEYLNKQGNAAKINEYYFSQLALNGVAYNGAEEFLDEIAEVATIAAATNGVERVQKSRCGSAGLIKYFDEFFVSDRVGCAKPNPKFFDNAIRALGINNRKRVLVVGDSLKADIKGGINAKLDTCWVNFDHIVNPTDIKPTYTVESYEELKQIIYGEDGPPDAETRNKHREDADKLSVK